MTASSNQDAGRAVPFGTYAAIHLALLLLVMGALARTWLHLGGVAVALAIASGKALLLLCFFMHRSAQSSSSRMGVAAPAVPIGALVTSTAPDVVTRPMCPARAETAPSSGLYRKGAPCSGFP